MIRIQPEDITDRFHELFPPRQVPQPVAGDGKAGRHSKQWETLGGRAQIKCELCPKPDLPYCAISCNEARSKFDETDPVKVT